VPKQRSDGREYVIGANGKKCFRVTGSCTCCGCDGHEYEPGKPYRWLIWRAGWCDDDGTYYARLCGSPNERAGCIYEVKPAKSERNRKAQILRALMPSEEDDGVVTMMEDMKEE